MQYALVNGQKMLPASGLRGICPGCSKDVIAKCGNIKLHHWAHRNLKDCDPWWESETEWHREWKNQFPESYREIVFPDGNEIHRADIHTPQGVTIEFQNSPISLDELKSRESFYKQLIWVVNGLKFRGGFELTCNIPNPQHLLLDRFAILGIGKYSENKGDNLMFQDMPEIDAGETFQLYRIFSFRDPELKKVAELYKRTPPIYWMFNWKHKHRAWFDCNAYVFFDFGDNFLYWLKKRKQFSGVMYYLHSIEKHVFLSKYSK